MSIDVRIDDEKKVVLAIPRGTLTHDDLITYQTSVWSRPELAGYHELVDMTQVEKVAYDSSAKVRQLAQISAAMDDLHGASRMAIVAVKDEHFGLARMYQNFRESNPRTLRELRVFRTPEEAWAWLRSPAGAAS